MRKKSRFIFQRMWLEHPTFMSVVAKAWDTHVEGHPGYVFARKVSHVSITLKDWNWNTFGNLNDNVKHQ